jgi:hypothetical protein
MMFCTYEDDIRFVPNTIFCGYSYVKYINI